MNNNAMTTDAKKTSSSASPTTYYVSITGFKLKSILYLPRFFIYSNPALKQAHEAEGNISASTDYVNGILHTLSVWKDRKSMTRYMAKGAHAQAMKAADEMGDPSDTKVYGYETDKIPTWDEALALWSEHGTRHGKKVVGGGRHSNKREKKSNATNSINGGYRQTTLVTLVTATLVCSVVLFAGHSFFMTTTGAEAPVIVQDIL